MFSQPIGFVPRFPAPPKYIKVRSRGKKEKDFNRVFLAQELRGRTGVEIAQAGGRSAKSGPVNPAAKSQDGNAVWAMGFSKDGRFLAAGGHDHIVRVWAVIANEEDRTMHEAAPNNEGARTRLSAPVFKTKPVQEYQGHTASVLDLSWSKVSQPHKECGSSLTDRRRTISFSPRLWTRLYDYGTHRAPSVCAVSSTATSSLPSNSIQETIASFLLAHWTRNFGCGAFLTKVLHSGANFRI